MDLILAAGLIFIGTMMLNEKQLHHFHGFYRTYNWNCTPKKNPRLGRRLKSTGNKPEKNVVQTYLSRNVMGFA